MNSCIYRFIEASHWFWEVFIGTWDRSYILDLPKTPPLSSEYTMHIDVKDGKKVLVCTVGKTVLLYNIDSLNDLH